MRLGRDGSQGQAETKAIWKSRPSGKHRKMEQEEWSETVNEQVKLSRLESRVVADESRAIAGARKLGERRKKLELGYILRYQVLAVCNPRS